MRRWISISIGALVAIVGAQGALANGLGDLAPPGPCAEAEAALRKEPAGFDVAGSPRAHFDPTDVAGPRGDDPFVPPRPPSVQRSPCDAPTADCAGAVTPLERGVIQEPPPGPAMPPGTTPFPGADR